jgi:hypothetical protein
VPKVLGALIQTAGGSITEDLKQADSFLLGDAEDSRGWVAEMRAKDDILGTEQLEYALQLASKKKVLTTRFIYDCLEEGRILKPTIKANHVITMKGESIPAGLEGERQGVVDMDVTQGSSSSSSHGNGNGKHEVPSTSSKLGGRKRDSRGVYKKKGTDPVSGNNNFSLYSTLFINFFTEVLM